MKPSSDFSIASRFSSMVLTALREAERDHTCRYGTRCHEIAESVLQGLELPHSPESEKEKAAFASIWDYCSKTILPNAETLECEKMVFAHSWGIAGTVDLLLQRPNGDFWILDWKTNKRIRREGFQGRTAKVPVEHLPDCEMTKYSLQLNLYERILRREDYLPQGAKVDRGLLYVNPDTHEGVKYIEIPLMQSSISLMLIDHLENRGLPF